MTITGTGFTGATSVKFGAVSATAFSVVSSTSITAVSPANGALTNADDVSVTTMGGSSATSSADTFTYTVTAPPHSVALTMDSTGLTVPVGTAVTFAATANQDVAQGQYVLSIVDTTTRAFLSSVSSVTTTSVAVSQSLTTTQTYVGEIGTL